MSSNIFEIFTSAEGSADIKVHFEGETCWLTLSQLAMLYQRDKSVISRHISNIFKENELEPASTVADYATVQEESGREVLRTIRHYNLDMILSVGYRVNSMQGTRFRKWATQRLRASLLEQLDHSSRVIRSREEEIHILHDGISVLQRAVRVFAASMPHFDWLRAFDSSLQLISDYDHRSLDTSGSRMSDAVYPALKEYKDVIDYLRSESPSEIFGVEVHGGFLSAVMQIQAASSNGDYYPSLEEKAAMLLYLIVKNHAFIDGNKRIAAACFLLFLKSNEMLYDRGGSTVISNDGLAGLTLFVASSDASDMETVKRLLISVLNRSLIQP